MTDNDSQYCHPFVVICDDTYGHIDDSEIVIVNQRGYELLDDGDIREAFEDHGVCINMRDLIEAYNQVHGTNY